MKYISSQKNKGFTLVELLVSIAIIGLLSTVVFASYSQAQKKARIARRVSDLKQVQTALAYYYAVNKSYPNTSWEWRSTCSSWGSYAPNNVIPGLVPNYIANIPADPQTNAAANTSCYIYASNGTDYFFKAYNIAEFSHADYLSKPELVDPAMDGGANLQIVDGVTPWAWKVYTPGIAGW